MRSVTHCALSGRAFGLGVLGLGALALSACLAPMEQSAPSGAALFAEKCAGCHGTDARGEGAFGAQLIRTPPDLTLIARRHGGRFPRDYVMSSVDGYRRAHGFSDAMPHFGEGDLGPLITADLGDGRATQVPRDLLALSQYVESLQR